MVSYIKGVARAKGIRKQDPRRIFIPKLDENWEWKGDQNQEIHSLYNSPNKVGMIESKS